jgi:hypothetical protein
MVSTPEARSGANQIVISKSFALRRLQLGQQLGRSRVQGLGYVLNNPI